MGMLDTGPGDVPGTVEDGRGVNAGDGVNVGPCVAVAPGPDVTVVGWRPSAIKRRVTAEARAIRNTSKRSSKPIFLLERGASVLGSCAMDTVVALSADVLGLVITAGRGAATGKTTGAASAGFVAGGCFAIG